MKWLYRGIGIVLFAAILHRMDYARVLVSCGRALATSPWLAWVPLIFLPTMALKAWRWGTLLRGQGIEVPFEERFSATLASFFAGFLTPGRLGEFLKAVPITQRGYSTSVAFVSLVLEKLLDLGVLGVLAWVGLLGLSQLPRMPMVMASLAILIPVGLGAAFLARPHAWLSLGSWVVPESLRRRLGGAAQTFAGECRKLTPGQWASVTLSTGMAWMAHFAQFSLLCLALAIPLSFLQVMTVASIVMVASVLPITVMGLGTREASLLFLFHALGLQQVEALSLGLLLLTLSLAHAALAGIAWWCRPLMIRAAASS